MAKEIEDTETQKSNMMKRITEKNLQIKKMEERMEKPTNEKEEDVNNAQTLIDIVPFETIPTTKVSTSATTTTTGVAEGAEQLGEVVQNLSIQTGETNKLKDELKELHLMKSVAYTSHVVELNRAKG